MLQIPLAGSVRSTLECCQTVRPNMVLVTKTICLVLVRYTVDVVNAVHWPFQRQELIQLLAKKSEACRLLCLWQDSQADESFAASSAR